MTEKERIDQIDAAPVDISRTLTDFELKVLNTLRKQRFGGAKQLKVLAEIEKKIFGRHFDLEPTRRKVA